MLEDSDLIRLHVHDRSPDAFRELVGRHINFVYSAALRQTNGDTHLAQEVTQIVFTDLARKAEALQDRRVLAGWLFVSARYAAAKLIRRERRRRGYEQEAHLMNELMRKSDPEPEWEQLRPVLDQALAGLAGSDREAIFLRFFEGRAFSEVGARLALNENAARMRVERALEKLRQRLTRQGVRSTTGALALLLGSQAVAAAPAGLATSISGAAIAAATGGAVSAAITFMSISKLQLGIISTVVAVVAAGLAVQESTRLTAERELAALAQETSPRVSPAISPLSPPAVQTPSPSTNPDVELARLADEAAALRQSLQASAKNVHSSSAPDRHPSSVAPSDPAQLDKAPQVIKRKPPAYPAELMASGTTGSVVVDFIVDPTGSVQNAKAVSSTDQRFEAAAIESVASWKFEAGTKGGRLVNTRLQQVITFSISNQKTPVSNWF